MHRLLQNTRASRPTHSHFMSSSFMCGEAARVPIENMVVCGEAAQSLRRSREKGAEKPLIVAGKPLNKALVFGRKACLPGQPRCNVAIQHDPGVMPSHQFCYRRLRRSRLRFAEKPLKVCGEAAHGSQINCCRRFAEKPLKVCS